MTESSVLLPENGKINSSAPVECASNIGPFEVLIIVYVFDAKAGSWVRRDNLWLTRSAAHC